MQEFTAKYADKIQGVVSGFDRLVFRGSLRKICYPFGMEGYLWAIQVPLKEFGKHVHKVSGQVKDGALRCMLEAGVRCSTFHRARTIKRKSRARSRGKTR